MKKPNNIVLWIAISCFAVTFLWSVTRFLIHIAVLSKGDSALVFYVFNELIPALSLLLVMALPVWLLVRNLKSKSGKAFPVLVMVVNAAFLVMSIVSMSLPAIYRYMLWSTLGLVDTTLGVVLMALCGGSVLLLVGYALSVSGCILSLLGQNEKVEETV